MRKRHTVEDRERLIAEVKATGKTPRVVAERLGVCVSSAYRWVKEASSSQAPVFARVVQSRPSLRSGLVVHVGGAAIGIEAGFDADLLRDLVAALGESK
ncbi:MAG: helix-turn-helix domain-containing protein [Polyangiaceae bacterium]